MIDVVKIQQFLDDISNGIIKITPTVEPQEVYAGNVEYIASNGWKITIFNDCNDWDYVDNIVDNEGNVFDYDALSDVELYPSVSNDVAWRIYRIPGYLTYRCVTCGNKLMDNEAPNYDTYKCRGHK